MSWLIWKEYRVNRLILLVGLGLLLVPHLIALIVTLRHPDQWEECFRASTGSSFFLTQIVLPLLGGNAIAGERNDRSAEFLACLPFSRWQNLISKLVLAPLVAVAICSVNFVFLLFVLGEEVSTHEIIAHFQRRPGDLIVPACYVVTPLVFFCVGWLFSSFLKSAVFSSAAGLITPFVVIWCVYGMALWLKIDDHDQNFEFFMACWYAGLCFVLSMVSFIVGSCYYLRRVEP